MQLLKTQRSIHGSWIYYGEALVRRQEITSAPPRRQNVFPSKGVAINITWFTFKCTPVALKRAFSETDLQPNELFMNLSFPQRREGWKFMVNFMQAQQPWSNHRSGAAVWFYAVTYVWSQLQFVLSSFLLKTQKKVVKTWRELCLSLVILVCLCVWMCVCVWWMCVCERGRLFC